MKIFYKNIISFMVIFFIFLMSYTVAMYLTLPTYLMETGGSLTFLETLQNNVLLGLAGDQLQRVDLAHEMYVGKFGDSSLIAKVNLSFFVGLYIMYVIMSLILLYAAP